MNSGDGDSTLYSFSTLLTDGPFGGGSASKEAIQLSDSPVRSASFRSVSSRGLSRNSRTVRVRRVGLSMFVLSVGLRGTIPERRTDTSMFCDILKKFLKSESTGLTALQVWLNSQYETKEKYISNHRVLEDTTVTDSFPQVVQNQTFEQAALLPTAAPLTPALSKEQINHLVSDWINAKEQLAQLKVRENQLRLELNKCEQLFDPRKFKGSQHYDLGLGYSLSLVRPETKKVENSQNQAQHAVLALKALGPDAAARADELFKFEAKLVNKVYNDLTDREKAIVNPLITSKVGSPQISFVKPKPASDK